jgi:hypothetical protein
MIGRPVALVRVANEGTPRLGVTRTGLVASTILPVPVTAAPKVTPPYVSVLDRVVAPVTPSVPPTVVLPVSVLAPATPSVLDRVVAPVTPSVPPTVVLPVSVLAPVTPSVVPTVTAPDTATDVAEAAPSVGVTSVGELLRTTEPVPVDVVVPVPPEVTGSDDASVSEVR